MHFRNVRNAIPSAVNDFSRETELQNIIQVLGEWSLISGRDMNFSVMSKTRCRGAEGRLYVQTSTK